MQFGRTCSWLALGFYPRNLNLEEARLVPKEVSLSLLTRALDLDKPLRDAAFKEFDGLKLRKRDLRFADLSGAMLPKADLREVRLQGAHLFDAQLQGAVLFDAQLQGADLEGAQLQDAYLFDAKLQGAVLRGAELQGADLSGAKLQGADLSAAHLQYAGLVHTQLQGAYLRGAELQGAYMNDAKLQGASLTYAQLQGAGLEDAQLQGADLSGAVLQGINWSLANLDDIFIVNSSKSDWSEQQQRELEVILKPLLDENSFADFQKRMERASKGLPPGESASQTGCYSDNPALLECKYRQPTQRDAYRTAVLHPKLIELACSDAAIAEGIARRGYQMPISDEHDFGLAAALLKVLDAQKRILCIFVRKYTRVYAQ